MEGISVAKDEIKGIYFFTKSAEQGNARAQNNLAFCYYNGKGVPKDINKTLYWLHKSADQGHIPAQYQLGTLYLNGEDIQCGVASGSVKIRALETDSTLSKLSIPNTPLTPAFNNNVKDYTANVKDVTSFYLNRN